MSLARYRGFFFPEVNAIDESSVLVPLDLSELSVEVGVNQESGEMRAVIIWSRVVGRNVEHYA